MSKLQWLSIWALAGMTNSDLERWSRGIDNLLTDPRGRHHFSEFAISREFNRENMAIQLWEKCHAALNQGGPVSQDTAIELVKDAENDELMLPCAEVDRIKDTVDAGESQSAVRCLADLLKADLEDIYTTFINHMKNKKPPRSDKCIII